ncbi:MULTISPECIES: TOBE domain-containing protein [unclassified Nitratiruptor]|uniref:TOBE domain-containing protein n=1 Tax=unclassified Nitratiruptor TaxID=2624044 RepID=UPI001915B611|nr:MULTISPECIES: TOBE domain-containing protein [unclassified Nitratiruptor]BCD59420.1 molybdate transport system regulatory protein [Nitratiruptor sp. YY08-10]BCD63344.1 molybdate transport system regulatory protein [Nitratiruptor sp. YY08-14]
MQLGLSPYLDIGGKRVDIHKVCTLLEALQEEGSLLRASKKCAMSYKGVWDLLALLNSEKEQLTSSKIGGLRGGGSDLTPFGKRLLQKMQELLEIEHQLNRLIKSYETINGLKQFKKLLQNSLYKNIIPVVIEEVKTKGKEVVVAGSYNQNRLKARVSKPKEQFFVGQKVYFVFDPSAANHKGENFLKGIYAGKESGKTKLIVDDLEILVEGKVELKNGLAYVSIRPKSIQVIPCNFD